MNDETHYWRRENKSVAGRKRRNASDEGWRPPAVLPYVTVYPGEHTCLDCGSVFVPPDICPLCGQSEEKPDGKHRWHGRSVPTTNYLREDEYRVLLTARP